MTAEGESVIYAYMETDSTTEALVEKDYEKMDEAVHSYLDQLTSSVPVVTLFECHYIEVHSHWEIYL